MELISVVVPCYNEEESLPLFYDEIIRVSDSMKAENDVEFEFVFVNDGSRDKTLILLRELAEKDSRVRYVSFSRNFGKEAAMIAGLEHTNGDYVVLLDADLQHPPKLIPQMYEYVSSGEYDCAATRRISRKGEPKLLSFFAAQFYRIINKISQTQIVNGAQDFRFMTRQMVDAIISMSEYHRFSKGIFSWVGFNTKFIEIENTERAAGTTTWNFKKLFLYSLEGIMAFSTAPLALPIFLGILSCIIAVIIFIVTLVQFFASDISMVRFANIVCLIMLMSGITMICTGINGLYLSKTYMEVKHRPKYIVKETEENRPKN